MFYSRPGKRKEFVNNDAICHGLDKMHFPSLCCNWLNVDTFLHVFLEPKKVLYF